jgi:hypothetical protein
MAMSVNVGSITIFKQASLLVDMLPETAWLMPE